MRNTILIFSILAFATGLRAQTELRYNLAADSLSWFKNGKPARQPRLKPGQEITVRLTEFNNYLYDASVEAEAVSGDGDASAFEGLTSFSQMISGFMPGGSGLLGSGMFSGFGFGGPAAATPDSSASSSRGLSLLEIPLLRINDRDISLKNLFKGSRGDDELELQVKQAMRDVSESVEAFREAYTDLKKIEQSALASRMAAEQIEALCLRPGLRPSTIRKAVDDYYQLVFRSAPGNEISVNDLLTWQQMPAQFAANLNELRRNYPEFEGRLQHLDAVGSQLGQLDAGDDAAFAAFFKDFRATQKQALLASSQWRQILAEGDNALKTNFLPSASDIARLQMRMAEVRQNAFTHTAVISLEDGATLLTIKLFQKKLAVAALPDSVAAKPVKTLQFRLQASGGLRIRAGMGMNFSQFFSPAQQYTVRNGAIASERADLVRPAVTSVIHFYPNARRGPALGGAFGLGLPLMSDGMGVSFYLGPSLLMGKSRRLAMSAGLSLGPAARLARGFSVGDAFDLSNGDIPLRNRYETGWFAGLSFNMGR